MVAEGDGGMYAVVENRRLRRGHTTGTCAAAASKAAALALLGEPPATVSVSTPRGIVLDLPVEDLRVSEGRASCAVRKDGGDDVDATHGALVYSEVSLSDGGISIDGGRGVGRVTRRGLDQPPGAAAINRVPRAMIRECLEDVASSLGYAGGFDVVISVPDGEAIAPRTFNPRLGIEGGISILGTSGIVEPMSEKALIETIRTEMRMRAAGGERTLLVVPGNYGKDFSDGIPGIDSDAAVKCSNFVGEMLDCAVELGVDVVLVSNLGKIVKVAGGIMNTHSRNADARMEILAANAAMAGASLDCVKKIMGCISTDDALEAIDAEHLVEETSMVLADKIEYHMNHLTGGAVRTGAVMFSSVYGLLAKTSLADGLLDEVRRAQARGSTRSRSRPTDAPRPSA